MTIFVTLSSWTASPLFGIVISDDSIYRGLLFTEQPFLWILISDDSDRDHKMLNDFVDSHH